MRRIALSWIIALVGGMLAVGLAAAPAQAGTAESAAVTFTTHDGESASLVSEGLAGDRNGYEISIAFETEISAAAEDTITVAAPSGTKFPSAASDYVMFDLGDSQNDLLQQAPVLTDDGATVTISLKDADMTVEADHQFLLMIGRNTNGVTNPPRAGEHTLSVSSSKDSAVVSAPYTIQPNSATRVSIVSGGGQSARVGRDFASPIRAKVTDDYGNRVPNERVIFWAAGSGPAGSFASPGADTNARGIASSGTVTANTVAGDWDAGASIHGDGPNDTATMTNEPGRPASLGAGLGRSKIVADGYSRTSVWAEVLDAYGNRVRGRDIDFSADDPGLSISAVKEQATGRYTALITASTTPGTVQIHATYGYMLDIVELEELSDDVKPVTTITKGPGATTSDRTPTFAFKSNEPKSSFVCSVDRAVAVDCDSPLTLRRLSFGRHTLAVRAIDPAGNTGDAAIYRFRVTG